MCVREREREGGRGRERERERVRERYALFHCFGYSTAMKTITATTEKSYREGKWFKKNYSTSTPIITILL